MRAHLSLRRLTATVCTLALLALAGCGDDGSDSGDAGSSPTSTETTGTETTPAAPAATKDSLGQPLGQKPTIEKPTGKPPKQLEVEDLAPGTGAEAQPGQQLTVQYVGVSFKTGKQFDASWDNGQPFPFQLGAGMVIPGWDQGLVGMKVGGRRKLTIPPDLAYGPAGSGPIGPNETLVFVIDLLEAA